MNKLFTVIVLLFSFHLMAQTSWRDQEMEVKIALKDARQMEQLHQLRLNGDVYPDATGRLYLIPSELEKISQLGIAYEILIPDLNSHYQDFWDTREEYHSYQEIIDLADSLAQFFPAICQKTVHGYSMEGRQLASLKISDNVTLNETEAVMWFDGGIHGDEIGGAENLIRFARDLCLGYGNDDEITTLVNSREIWIYLMVNPDGRVNMVRYNLNGVDLNRDWGYMWDGWGGSTGAYSQVETKVMRDLFFSLQPSVSLTYHSGVELALYPWGYRYSQANDNAHLSFIAHHYSDVSGYENLVAEQSVELYPVSGGSTDVYYGVQGSAGLTVELSDEKQPPVSLLMHYYLINYPSMIAMVRQAGYGIEGIVTDALTGNPVQALIYVSNYYPVYSDSLIGDFHKFVLPGTYSVKIAANGYESATVDNVVVNENSSAYLPVELTPSENHFAYQVISTRIPGINNNDEGYTPGILGTPDDIRYSIGKNGWIVVDLQQVILDGIGDEIIVYEGDDTPESFSCFAGSSPDGPWNLLGTGTGTTAFDFADGLVADARYIKILDDGDGSSLVSDAGFDADAVEVKDHPPGTHLTLLSFVLDDVNGNDDGFLDPGEAADLWITLRNNGDIPAEEVTAVLSTGQLFITIDSANATLENMAFGQSSSAHFAISASELTPMGTVFNLVLSVEANDNAYVRTFYFDLPVGRISEDWETGTLDQFDWQTGGNASWSVVQNQAWEGSWCARSGSFPNNGSSTLSITLDVVAGGQISFFRKVSSEAGYDFLEFHIDNTLTGAWSGEAGWEQVTYDVSQGTHTFEWIYSKDYYASEGSDCGWIDFIRFPPLPVTSLGTITGTVTDLTSGLPLENASISGVALTGSDGSYSFQLSEGTYELCASADGYETLCLEVNVMTGQATVTDFQLMPAFGMTHPARADQVLQVFPNPSDGRVTIELTGESSSLARVEIYSVTGNLVQTLGDPDQGSGYATYTWDGKDQSGNEVPQGIYLCRVFLADRNLTIKLFRF